MALALGRTVNELRATISNAEYEAWKRYALIEPFGFPRSEARYATIMTGLFATSNGKPQREQLNPSFWKYKSPVPQRVQTADEVFAAFRQQYGKS